MPPGNVASSLSNPRLSKFMISASNTADRPQLSKLMKKLAPGDVVSGREAGLLLSMLPKIRLSASFDSLDRAK